MSDLLDLLARLFSDSGRRWMYGIAIAAIPLGIALDWFTPETAALIAPLVMAILKVPDSVDRLRLRDLDAD